MLKKIETTANERTLGSSFQRPPPPRVCTCGGRRAPSPNVERGASGGDERRATAEDTSVAPAFVRRSSVTRSSQCRWASSFVFFIYPLALRALHQPLRLGRLREDRARSAAATTRSCGTTRSSGGAIKNTPQVHGRVGVRSRWRLASRWRVIVNAGIRGRSFFRSAFYFPSLASSAAITAIAIYILSADGLLNADHRRATGRGSATPTRRSGRLPA